MSFKHGLRNIRNIIFELAESRKRLTRIKKKFCIRSMKKIMVSVNGIKFSDFIKLQTPSRLGVFKNYIPDIAQTVFE